MSAEQYLDVSELEPPEPLLLSMAAARALGSGQYLRLRHRRRPCMLYDNIQPEGFVLDTRRAEDGLCEVFIWRGEDAQAAAAAAQAAQGLEAWTD